MTRRRGSFSQPAAAAMKFVLSNCGFKNLSVISKGGNSHTRETVSGLRLNLGTLQKLQGVPLKTLLMQLPSEEGCKGKNQTKPVRSRQNSVVAAM